MNQVQIQLPLHIKDQIDEYVQRMELIDLYTGHGYKQHKLIRKLLHEPPSDLMSQFVFQIKDNNKPIRFSYRVDLEKRMVQILPDRSNTSRSMMVSFEQSPLKIPPDMLLYMEEFDEYFTSTELQNVLTDSLHVMEDPRDDMFRVTDYRVLFRILHQRYLHTDIRESYFINLNPNSPHYMQVFRNGLDYYRVCGKYVRVNRKVANTFTDWFINRAF